MDPQRRAALVTYLNDISQWIMTLDVGSGTLKNVGDETEWSIFINGNFARTLMVAHQITDNEAYLTESLRWCDTFVGQQQAVVTSTHENGGYWGDHGETGNIYLADAGTAATALAMGYRRADPARQAIYLEALDRFTRFIRTGCLDDPQGEGRGGSSGWVIKAGEDRGALGCGYYRGHLSPDPYTISSGVTASCMMSMMYSINEDPDLKAIADGAVRWMFTIRDNDGLFPIIIDGKPPNDDTPLAALNYCSEGFIAAYAHCDDPALQEHIAQQIVPSVEWLLENQNSDGYWGTMCEYDCQRSPCVVRLLSWYYHNVTPDPDVKEAVLKYCDFLLDPDNSEAYGVKEHVRTTGFVGLTIAEILEPGITFDDAASVPEPTGAVLLLGGMVSLLLLTRCRGCRIPGRPSSS